MLQRPAGQCGLLQRRRVTAVPGRARQVPLRPTTVQAPPHIRYTHVTATSGSIDQSLSASSPGDPHSSQQSSTTTSANPTTLEARLAAICSRATTLFPLWVVLAAGLALCHPPAFTWISTKYVTYGLGLTMLGMGLTMRMEQFSTVLTSQPQLLLLGMALQYMVMPGLGYMLSRYAGLDPPLAIGMAILSACPGGTASNIVAYIARGDMPLSIMMTTASTLAAVAATPLITAALVGTLVPVDAKALFMSTLQVVLAPVLMGAAVNQRFPATVARVSQFTPLVATLLVSVIVGVTLAHSAEAARQSGFKLFGAVLTLHSCGFIIGYAVSKALGLNEQISRTNSIEVGMQNATLGAVLASLHFANPLTAAPCAVSSCTQSVLGSLVAAWWREGDDRKAREAGGLAAAR